MPIKKTVPRERPRRRIKAPDNSNEESLRLQKRDRLKKEYLKKLQKNMGLITKTAHDLGISRRTAEKWRKEDSEFNDSVLEVLTLTRDWVEGKLLKKIEEGNFNAIRFYLLCKGRKEEVPSTWVTRTELAGADDSPLIVERRRESISDSALATGMAKAKRAHPELFEDDDDDGDE